VLRLPDYLPHDNGMTGQIYYAVSFIPSALGVQLWIDVSACSE
jgi:hypothetical protein